MSYDAKRRIRAVDLGAVARVGQLSPCPSGEWVVVTVTVPRAVSASADRLFLIDRASSAVRALTSEDVSCTTPRVSPDGRRIAHVRAAGRGAQVCVVDASGHDLRTVAPFQRAVADLEWMPDGRGLVAAVVVEGSESNRGPRVTEDRVVRFWNRWLTAPTLVHLLRIDLASGAVANLTPELARPFDWMNPVGQIAVAPDGTKVAFSALAEGAPFATTLRSTIHIVDTVDGSVRPLAAERDADDVRPRFSPDGRVVAFLTRRDPADTGAPMRVVLNQDGRTRLAFPEWAGFVQDHRFRADGSLLLEVEEEGRTHLYVGEPDDPSPRPLARGASIGQARPARSGQIFALEQSVSRPPEVVVLEPDRAWRRVSVFNDDLVAALDLGPVEEAWYVDARGRRLHTYLVHPPPSPAARPAPLLHSLHGGPNAAHLDAWSSRFNPHVLAADGCLVALVNFHGSTGYGETFARTTNGSWAEQPAADILRVTEKLVADGRCDARRMALIGPSYGGYLAWWLATCTSRFSCLVVHAAPFDLTALASSDLTHGFALQWGSTPWDSDGRNRPLDRMNPAARADRLRTPALITHGERDYRIPLTQALSAYGTMKGLGVPARLAVYPDEGHWLRSAASAHWYEEARLWLRRWGVYAA